MHLLVERRYARTVGTAQDRQRTVLLGFPHTQLKAVEKHRCAEAWGF